MSGNISSSPKQLLLMVHCLLVLRLCVAMDASCSKAMFLLLAYCLLLTPLCVRFGFGLEPLKVLNGKRSSVTGFWK